MNAATTQAIRIGTAVAITAVKKVSANRAAKREEQNLLDDSLMGHAIESKPEPIRVTAERLA